MSSVARDERGPSAAPIFIESEEEIPAVIERVATAAAEDVPLVLPARSRFGQSRFNFQLLRDYSQRLGKRVSIISPDASVQRMAEENGFSSYRAIDQYRPGRGDSQPPAAGRPGPVGPPVPAAADSQVRRPSIRVAPPDAALPRAPAAEGSAPPSPQPVGGEEAGAPRRAPVIGVVPPGAGVPPVRPVTPAASAAPAGASVPPVAPAPTPVSVGVPPVAARPPGGPVEPGSSATAGASGQALSGASVRPRQQPPVRVVSPPSGSTDAARRAPRIKVTAPRTLPSRLAAQAPSRLLLYGGALLVLLVGIVATAVYVPSAKVTLVAEATPFASDVTVSAEPGKSPIRVRTVTLSREATMTQKATGVKTIPGAVAAGTVTYTNICPSGFIIPDGQVLVEANGVQFAQKGAVTVGPKSPLGPPAVVAASVVARSPGVAGNTPGGAAALQPAGDAGSCLAAAASPTAGGADEQKKTVVSTADYDTARAALEGQLKKQAVDEFTKQLQGGEKLADPTVTLDSAFTANKKVDDEGSDFQATLTLKIEGALYQADDVNRAFSTAIQKQLPAGQQLTGNEAKLDYKLSDVSPGGHLTFEGKASGYQAPKLDLAKVRSQLPGEPTGKARTELAKLPGVQAVEIDQSPVKLPILPLTGSRIDLQYVVSQAPAAKSS